MIKTIQTLIFLIFRYGPWSWTNIWAVQYGKAVVQVKNYFFLILLTYDQIDWCFQWNKIFYNANLKYKYLKLSSSKANRLQKHLKARKSKPSRSYCSLLFAGRLYDSSFYFDLVRTLHVSQHLKWNRIFYRIGYSEWW